MTRPSKGERMSKMKKHVVISDDGSMRVVKMTPELAKKLTEHARVPVLVVTKR